MSVETRSTLPLSETKLQGQVRKYLSRLKSCWHYRANDSWRAGIPDLIGCYYGYFFAIELKVQDKKPTAIQEITLEEIINHGGGEACVARSLKEVKKFMEVLHARHLERQP